MRLALVTTAGASFDGVFWTAYRRAEGPPPDVVFLLPSKSFRPLWQSLLEPFLLFSPRYLLRLGCARVLNRPVTRRDRERGLHRSLREIYPEVMYREADSLSDEPGLQQLTEEAPDVLVSVGAPEIFRPEVLKVPTLAALNVHNGRLPDYRGVFATFWELIEGEETGAVSLHRMAPEVDAGRVIRSAEVELTGDLFEILIRKKRVGGRLLAKSLQPAQLDIERDARPASGPDDQNYYSWPSLWDVARMRYRRSTPW